MCTKKIKIALLFITVLLFNSGLSAIEQEKRHDGKRILIKNTGGATENVADSTLWAIDVPRLKTKTVSTNFYVSPLGHDSNNGTTLSSPWKTIQHAADNASAGSIVHIAAGLYKERVVVNVSGNSTDGFITFLGASDGGTIIDGSDFSLEDMKSFKRSPLDTYGLGDASALLEIIDKSYLRFQNIEIRNYICSSTAVFPMGVMVLKQATSDLSMTELQFVNLNVHDIKNNTTSSDGGAQGFAVYGGDTTVAVEALQILGCEIHSCILGQSESVTLNGNIDNFLIENNKVHDNNNIGIVCIGWEGTAGSVIESSDPALVGGHHPNDRARNGIIRNNTVYNCSTEKPVRNPTYPKNDFSAGGIYIDGGKNITIEYNRVYSCDVGIEIASEHGGVDDDNNSRNTYGITCRNNIIYYCGQFGIGIGGYDKLRGDATECKILQNTVYKCSSLGFGGGQIYINKAHHNLISGNILVARGASDTNDYDGYNNSGNDWEWDHGMVLGSSLGTTYNHDNTLGSNLYYTEAGESGIRWKWKMTDSQDPNSGFSSLKNIDKHAVYGDPKFVKTTLSKVDGSEDFSIADLTAAGIDKGDAAQIANIGQEDFAGKSRVYNSIQDCGAYEYYPSNSSINAYPFPQSLTYPYGIKPDSFTQSVMNDKIKNIYDSWKQNYVKNDFADWTGYKVWRVDTSILTHPHNTVSEGQGYGMLVMVIMAGYDIDAKDIFDGMYWFFKEYQNSHGLMKWEVLQDGTTPDVSNATDGDMDIAMALIMADKQWGSEGKIDYAKEAKILIGNIMKWNVDSSKDDFGGSETNSWRLTCGDWWAESSDTSSQLTRMSDFMLNHLRVFERVSGNRDWEKVADRCYLLIDKMQQNYSPVGLVPDFIRDKTEEPAYANDIEGAHDGEYDYNSCRLPWRITIDYLFSGDIRSKESMEKIVSFIKSKTAGNPDSICDGYELNGDAYGEDYGEHSVSEAFLAPLGVAGMVDFSHQAWLNDSFEFITANDLNQGYYEDSLRLLSLLVMSGNWWNPVTSLKSEPTAEINILSASSNGAGVNITNGDNSPSVIDGTDFGNVNISNGATENNFVIQNSGTGTLSVGEIKITGNAAEDFSIVKEPALSISSKTESVFSIKFNPSQSGERVAIVSISNGDTDENPFSFFIKGNGTGGGTYTLKYSPGVNGTLSGETLQYVLEGENGTPVTPLPDAGYHFVEWSDGSKDNPRIDKNISANLTVTASFATNKLTFSISSLSPSENSGSISGSVTRNGGNNGELSVTLLSTNSSKITVPVSVSIPDGSSSVEFSLSVVDNYYADGDKNVTITGSASNYTSAIESIVVKDDETVSFSCSETELIIPGKGKTKNFEITLSGKPESDVVFSLSSSDDSLLFLSSSILTFSSENWSLPQIVVVTALKASGNGTIIVSVNDSASNDAFDSLENQNISITIGPRISLGSIFKIKATSVQDLDGNVLTEFSRSLRVYGKYKDPLSGNDKKTNIAVRTKIKRDETETDVKCEWIKNVRLYDLKSLKKANQKGVYTKTWLVDNPIDSLFVELAVKMNNVNDMLNNKLILTPPSIFSLSSWNGDSLDSITLQNNGLIVVKGKYFGIKPPLVWIEYKNSGNRIVKKRLKVLKPYKYQNRIWQKYRSCMNTETGDSEIRVLLPRNWWSDWSAGTYNLILDNRIGLAATSVNLGDDSANNVPVPKKDSFEISSGERFYLLDLLSNDSDPDSDNVKVIFESRNTEKGGRVFFDKRSGMVKFFPKKGIEKPYNDSFKYSLDDYHIDNLPTSVVVSITVE
jgi:endo-1,4-beta-D-glucanase Y